MNINFLPKDYLKLLDTAPGLTRMDKLKFVIALFGEAQASKQAKDAVEKNQ